MEFALNHSRSDMMMLQYLREIPAIHILKNDDRFTEYRETFKLSDHELTQLIQLK
ncbi:hypothetical protein KHA80_20675 [Anaerobacillus sp. HL2]|nr:hypothetical protein KHA80_20675 [Anaerobacillus sp. HL2]